MRKRRQGYGNGIQLFEVVVKLKVYLNPVLKDVFNTTSGLDSLVWTTTIVSLKASGLLSDQNVMKPYLAMPNRLRNSWTCQKMLL